MHQPGLSIVFRYFTISITVASKVLPVFSSGVWTPRTRRMMAKANTPSLKDSARALFIDLTAQRRDEFDRVDRNDFPDALIAPCLTGAQYLPQSATLAMVRARFLNESVADGETRYLHHDSAIPDSTHRRKRSILSLGQTPSHGIVPFSSRFTISDECVHTSLCDHRSNTQFTWLL